MHSTPENISAPRLRDAVAGLPAYIAGKSALTATSAALELTCGWVDVRTGAG